jgi:hypothetical protein
MFENANTDDFRVISQIFIRTQTSEALSFRLALSASRKKRRSALSAGISFCAVQRPAPDWSGQSRVDMAIDKAGNGLVVLRAASHLHAARRRAM